MRRFTVVLCVLGLVGCATGSPSLTHDSTLAAGEGVVLLRIVGNLEYPEWQSVQIRTGLDGAPISLLPVGWGLRGSTLLARSVPAGTYTPYEMFGSHTTGVPGYGGFTYEVTAPIANKTGTFRVAAGQVTDLGTIVYQPGKSLDATHSEFTIAVDPTPLRADAILASDFPAVAATVRGKPELGWDKLEIPAGERAQVVALAKSAARGTSSLTLTPTGAMYAGARLGQIVFRPKLDAEWHRLDTGSLNEITAVLAFPDGSMLAGGEQGFLTYSADRRVWQRLSLVDPSYVVTFLGQAPDRTLVAVAERGDDLVVYTSRSPLSGWRELRHFAPVAQSGFDRMMWGPSSRETKQAMGPLMRRERALFAGSRLAILEQPKTVWSYDFQSSAWSQSAPAPVPIFALRSTRDGYLWAVPVAGIRMAGSSDWGASWKKLEYFALDVPPVFTDRNNGYMAALPYGLTQTWQLMKTTDGGASWSNAGQLPGVLAERLVVDGSGHNVIAVTSSHDLWLSGDDGKTWQGPR